MSKRDVIAEIYSQVRAPEWAARNLDALADVLRDLSWLPDGPVELWLPDLSTLEQDDSVRLTTVLRNAVRESADGRHPLHLTGRRADGEGG